VGTLDSPMPFGGRDTQLTMTRVFGPEPPSKRVCDEAALGQVDRNLFWRRQFLNPYAFIGAPEAITALVS